MALGTLISRSDDGNDRLVHPAHSCRAKMFPNVHLLTCLFSLILNLQLGMASLERIVCGCSHLSPKAKFCPLCKLYRIVGNDEACKALYSYFSEIRNNVTEVCMNLQVDLWQLHLR